MLILRRVGDNWSSNEMTSHNVAACIGQCLLWPASHVRMSADGHLVAAKQLNQVVEKMINGARDIFGSDPLPFSLKSEFSSKTSKFFPYVPYANDTHTRNQRRKPVPENRYGFRRL